MQMRMPTRPTRPTTTTMTTATTTTMHEASINLPRLVLYCGVAVRAFEGVELVWQRITLKQADLVCAAATRAKLAKFLARRQRTHTDTGFGWCERAEFKWSAEERKMITAEHGRFGSVTGDSSSSARLSSGFVDLRFDAPIRFKIK